MLLTKEERQAHFTWASANKHQPSFCSGPVQDLDVLKLVPSQETIAAVFGVRKPESISIHEKESGRLVPLDGYVWPLEPKKEYEVVVSDNDDDDDPVVPINQIFPLFPGDSDDDKSDRIQKLSENFYGKLWNDDTGLRDVFFSRSSNVKIQAFRQYDWFHEVFGGPSMMDNYERTKHILPKVMAKHTSSRMTPQHAIEWLNIMNQALEEEFPNETQLKKALELYWLHFYAFFPFSDDDRREFRKVVSIH